MFWIRLFLCLAVLLGGATKTFSNSVPPPFNNVQPFDTDCLGPCGANYFGSFRIDGGPPTIRYFVATGGSLTLHFKVKQTFTVGPGNDFAIVTSSEGWTAPADNTALFQFFFGASLAVSFTSTLAPDQVFQFNLPTGLVSDRVVVTNLTSGDMAFDDAGAAYKVPGSPVPEPSTVVMLGTGLLGVLGAVLKKFLG